MIRPGLFLLFFLSFSASLLANSSMAVKSLNHMMSSLDHVSSVEVVVSADYMSSYERITANGTLTSYLDTHAVYQDDRDKKTFVKNKKGIFLVEKGEVESIDVFPIPIPTDFLDAFDSATLTQNYVFSVLKSNKDILELSVVPVFSVQLVPGEAVTTMLKLALIKPDFLLKKVEVFSNYQLKPNEVLEFEYIRLDYVPFGSRSMVFKKGYFISAFETFFQDIEKDSNGVQYFSRTRYEYSYRYVNQDMDMDIFDENDY